MASYEYKEQGKALGQHAQDCLQDSRMDATRGSPRTLEMRHEMKAHVTGGDSTRKHVDNGTGHTCKCKVSRLPTDLTFTKGADKQ